MNQIVLPIEEIYDYCMANHTHLICFGTGMVARHCIQLFQHYGIWDRVRCFLDHNRKITEFLVSGKAFSVYGPEELYKKQYEKDILLILCEASQEVLEQLESDGSVCNCSYILYPDINEQFIQGTLEVEKEKYQQIVETSARVYIPQQIHTCWFGKNKMPYLHQKFIEEWKICNPDYEIILWNESNYDVTKCRYIQEAYESENYAFVSDYVRMDVVYRYGGFYFDTDVEIIKSLEPFRKYQVVMAYGKWPAVNSGCGFGARKGHPLIRKIRDNPRGYVSFLDDEGKPKKITNCYWESSVLEQEGFFMDFSSQNKDGIQILSPYYFPSAPLWKSGGGEEKMIFAKHHDQGSWKHL